MASALSICEEWGGMAFWPIVSGDVRSDDDALRWNHVLGTFQDVTVTTSLATSGC